MVFSSIDLFNLRTVSTFWCALLAISDYKNAENIQHENRRVQEGLSKAQKLLKQSQKRDYYKILGVRRYYHAFLSLHL